ncbi:hypothetical protein JCM10207_006161 [Rhodosporidiobolus poonsookiae]
MTSKFSLEGKVAVVTGAASGIGLAIAKAFLDTGCLGVTFIDLRQDALSTAVAGLPSERVHLVAGDVGDESTASTYVKETLDRWGRLDISVQCAGITMPGTRLVDIEVETFDRIMRVNTRGVFLGMQKSIKAMGKGGSVIVISSQLGLDGFPGISPYAASKFAVRGLVASVAQEVGPEGIRVNAICPGPINTPLFLDDPSISLEPHVAKCNLRRAGEPEEIASAAVFLASEAGAYCSGTTLKVDGGWSKWC